MNVFYGGLIGLQNNMQKGAIAGEVYSPGYGPKVRRSNYHHRILKLCLFLFS